MKNPFRRRRQSIDKTLLHLPWYVCLGGSKETFETLGLYERSDHKVWVNEEAVLLDVKKPHWKSSVPRPKKINIKGLVIFKDIDEVDQYFEVSTEWRDHEIPFVIVYTNCERIIGFNEFFIKC